MGPEQVLAWYLKAALLVLEARSPQSSCDQTGFLLRAGEGLSEPAGGRAEGAATGRALSQLPWAFSGGQGEHARNGDFGARGLGAQAERSSGHQGPEVCVGVCLGSRAHVHLTADRTHSLGP